jgi:hypothetical protein
MNNRNRPAERLWEAEDLSGLTYPDVYGLRMLVLEPVVSTTAEDLEPSREHKLWRVAPHPGTKFEQLVPDVLLRAYLQLFERGYGCDDLWFDGEEIEWEKQKKLWGLT